MTQQPTKRRLGLVLAVVLAAGALTTVAAAENRQAAQSVKACANKKTGALRLAKGGCKASEKRVSWSVKGPRGAKGAPGPAGPQGLAGALTTTPVSVEYQATRASAYTLDVGDLHLALECGTNRIGASAVDVYIGGADEVHGTVVRTRYDGATVLATSTEALDVSDTTAAPSSLSTSGGTHATLQLDWLVLEDGVVHTLRLYATRDTRQGRPVCEFIGSLTEHGAATVVPS